MSPLYPNTQNSWDASFWCSHCELCPAAAPLVPWPSLSLYLPRWKWPFFNWWLLQEQNGGPDLWTGEFLLDSTQQDSDWLTRLKKLLWIVVNCQWARIWHILRDFHAVWWIRRFWHILKARSCLSEVLCCNWVKEQTKCISQFHTWMYQMFSIIQPVKYRRNLKNNSKTHPQGKKILRLLAEPSLLLDFK